MNVRSRWNSNATVGLVVALASGTACGAPSDGTEEDLGASAAEVHRGTRDDGHPAVGRLEFGGAVGPSVCTATLVAPDKILTARHCARPSVSDYRVYFAGQRYGVRPVTTAMRHATFDVAVLDLVRPVAGVSPVVLSAALPVVGQAITIVGFGAVDNAGTGVGVKRSATNTIGAVYAPDAIWVVNDSRRDATICAGDSGGPLFGTIGGEERQLAVAAGTFGPCVQRTGDVSYFVSTYAVVGFVRQRAPGAVVR
jgi:hypothetical protein